jgi:hypothetical protein
MREFVIPYYVMVNLTVLFEFQIFVDCKISTHLNSLPQAIFDIIKIKNIPEIIGIQ